MRTVTWSNAFARSFKRWVRKRPDMHKDIAEALGLLVVNPFIPQLETHKLKEKLSGSWACSAGYDLIENLHFRDVTGLGKKGRFPKIST